MGPPVTATNSSMTIFAVLLEKVLKNAVRHSTDTRAFYIWHASGTRAELISAMNAAGLSGTPVITWVKDGLFWGRRTTTGRPSPASMRARRARVLSSMDCRAESTAWTVNPVATADGLKSSRYPHGVRISNGRGAEIFVAARAPEAKETPPDPPAAAGQAHDHNRQRSLRTSGRSHATHEVAAPDDEAARARRPRDPQQLPPRRNRSRHVRRRWLHDGRSRT